MVPRGTQTVQLCEQCYVRCNLGAIHTRRALLKRKVLRLRAGEIPFGYRSDSDGVLEENQEEEEGKGGKSPEHRAILDRIRHGGQAQLWPDEAAASGGPGPEG